MQRVFASALIWGAIASSLASADDAADVREARAVYQEIQVDLKDGAFQKRVRTFESCERYEDNSRTLYSAESGPPRLFERQAGSDDSAVTWQHYYDESGRLRFVLITAGAVNGTHLEHRIWFDRAGDRIKEQQKKIAGPGYPFRDPWPDQDIARDPVKAFEAPNRCPEIGTPSHRAAGGGARRH